VAQLVHTQQQRLLLEESGLARSRPDAVIEFARPRGYPELLEVIKAHGYDLARRRGALPPQEKVAADLYDNVYVPGVAAVKQAGLPAAYRFKTEADRFLWVYERRRDLRVFDPDADFDAAAAYAEREGVGRRDRRMIESEKAQPLEPHQPMDLGGALRWSARRARVAHWPAPARRAMPAGPGASSPSRLVVRMHDWDAPDSPLYTVRFFFLTVTARA
jgi:hypothetical protein